LPDTRQSGTTTGHKVAHLDEIDEITDGRSPWRPIRHHFGITSFGVNSWTASQVGDRIINDHDEADGPDGGAEELYLVHAGRARFELDGERVDAPAGTMIFAQPGVKRTAFAEEPGTTIIVLGGTPGKAYDPVGWEIWAPLHRLYEAGQYAEAADRGVELIEANPEYPGLFYNLACCESLAGRLDDAIEHVGVALSRSQQLRALAAEDSDLDPIRERPEFKELLNP
jgi:tetratricopeptide (TPR) repeat protein